MYRHHVTTNDKAWQQKTNAWLVVLYSRFKRNRTLYCIVDRDAFTDKSMLAMHGGHEQFLCADQAPPSTITRAAQAYPTSSPQRIPRPPPPPQQPPQPMQQRGLLGALMNLPIVAITGSFGLLFGSHRTQHIRSSIPRKPAPASVMVQQDPRYAFCSALQRNLMSPTQGGCLRTH